MPYNFNSNLYKNASFLKKECSREEKSKIKEEDKKAKGKKQSLLKSVFILGIILILSRNTFGTVEKLSIEEKIQRSNRIVMGTVRLTQSLWEETEKGSRIFTYVYIDIEQYIKGSGGRLIEIKVPGGIVGEITQWVSDTPHFTQGEKVIVFLRPEFFQVVGWHQGKYSVKDDEVVALGIKVEKFINMIQRIDQESHYGPFEVWPTRINQSEKQLKSSKSTGFGQPTREKLNRAIEIKNEKEKKISGRPVYLVKEGLGPQSSPATLMEEDFEGVFPSGLWSVYGDPTWDDDDYKPYAGFWSAWCANGGSLALDPQFSNYADNMDSWMIYGPFDLSDAVNAELDFYYWNESEVGLDYFSWMASPDGTNFYGYKVSEDSGGWRDIIFDLANVPTVGNLCGESSVWIAFKFDSDSTLNYKGAFVDDIILQKTTGVSLPNLTPHKPTDWADKIVVSNHPGDHNDDSPLNSTDTLYIDWTVINNGEAATGVSFYSRLYVDAVLKHTWETPPPLDPGFYAYVEDYSIGSLSSGSHTIKIVADYDNRIAETDETDNEYQRTINIGGVPQILSISPSIASAGTDSVVTIDGSNFGTTQGAGKVEFFYKSEQPKIEAPIVSWSDTQIRCKVPVATVNGYHASSSSGPVTVTADAAGMSSGYTFKVTFGYGDIKWPETHPYISYEINENTPNCVGEGAAVIAAANEWSNRGARFTFVYGGPTNATDYSYNGHNEIMWSSVGEGAISVAVFWFSGSDLLECDIVFDDSHIWCTDGSAGKYDIQNVGIHELGHWLNFRDLYGDIGDGEYDTAKTMYGYVAAGETKKRTLHLDDIAGIGWIYGTGGDAWDLADNTGAGGTVLTPSLDTWQSHGPHTLTSSDEHDWYSIHMTTSDLYTFQSSCDFPALSGGDGDIRAYLYSDSAGTNLVASDDNSGENYQFDFSYQPDNSRYYYLKVEASSAGRFWSGYIDYKKEFLGNPPSVPTSPSPQNAAINVPLDTNIDWADSSDATSYDVYFGVTSPPAKVETVTGSFYDLGTLNSDTTYYWRIVAKNEFGETPGPEWNFATKVQLTLLATSGGTTNPAPGTYAYNKQTAVSIEAIPANYYRFSGWTGNIPSGHEKDNPITITMDSDKSVTAHFVKIGAPLNFTVKQEFNRSLLVGEYINVLSWGANPNNQSIAKYRIYLIEGTNESLLVELDAETFGYWHRRVEKDKTYTYSLSAVTEEGREGEPAFATLQGGGEGSKTAVKIQSKKGRSLSKLKESK